MDPSSFITTGGEHDHDLTGAWETINEEEGTKYIILIFYPLDFTFFSY